MASKAVHVETQRDKLERKEAAILRAARSVFVDNGFDGARMSEIAKRAGVGEGTIYSYYESKAELMLAVLQQFWDGLTLEARNVMADVKAPEAIRRLEALATYHLEILIQNADFINLSFALRRNNSEVSVSRDHLRQYVAVFDEIFRRGQDRGEFRPESLLWHARDVFYGTLEYSARSIEVVADSKSNNRPQKPVIDNLVALFASHFGKVNQSADVEKSAEQLNRIESKLDQLLP